MIRKVFTATPSGYHAELVEIEADISNGLPSTIIVGLPDTIVQESRERIRSAIKNSGYVYPSTRISINLAPSNIPKVGSHFDLAIALSIMQASGLISFKSQGKMFIGELSLDGNLRPSIGVLAMVLAAKAAGISEVYIPQQNYNEAALVEGVHIRPITDLRQLTAILEGRGGVDINLTNGSLIDLNQQQANHQIVDYVDIAGQRVAKRALLIAASGFHNVRMVGAPGSGKTMLAKALLGILPPLSKPEIIETTNIHSLSGKFSGVITTCPFRSPHHTTTTFALIGGGVKPRPGEVSLAHNGVLFLDELTEFPQHVLEVLRQPLEERSIRITRAHKSISFPARFILVTAQNPCFCGNYGDVLLTCSCSTKDIIRYNKKISGPLLDRIDLHINVPRLKYKEFNTKERENVMNDNSVVMQKLVSDARSLQTARLGEGRTNSDMNNTEIKKYCMLDDSSEQLLTVAANKYRLSGRAIHRLLKVARTIADLDNSKSICKEHLSESLQYRINN